MIKPMLAGKTVLSKLKYPLIASPKLDGIRGLIISGNLRSRALKPIPNKFVSDRFSSKALDGLDGELILGDPTAHDVYRKTQTATASHDGTPDVKFCVFDDFTNPDIPYSERLQSVSKRLKLLPISRRIHVEYHEATYIDDEQELLDHEKWVLDQGYEGLIIRSPDAPYKFGRGSATAGDMLKLKRFTDGEAEILSVYEEMENTNDKQTNELGRSKRSSHAAGLVPKGRAGGLRVRDVKSKVEFNIGTGFDDADRAYFWEFRESVQGKLIKYKSFLIGIKDLPRHPVYLGGREKWDL